MMAGEKNQVSDPAPVYNISGKVRSNYDKQNAARGVYTNPAFVGAQTAVHPVSSVQHPVASPTAGHTRTRIVGIVMGLFGVVLLLGVIGTVVAVVLNNRNKTESGTGSQPTQRPQQSTELPHSRQTPTSQQSTEITHPLHTETSKPTGTSQQSTEATQSLSTETSQPTKTSQQSTEATQLLPTETSQPTSQQSTEATQSLPTETSRPTGTSQQPTDPPVLIEGDIFNTGICGTQPVLDNRILGGSNSDLGTWPWIGALLTGDEQGCGATLINSRWAVTAAHCIVDPGFTPPDSIAFGLTDLTNHGSFSQQSGFLRMITHHLYDSDDPAAEYDITLLHLSQTIQFTNYVRPVCLATLEQETSVYSNCYAAGWGALVEARSSSSYISSVAADYPDILQEVSLPLISSADCKDIDDRVTSNIICGAGTRRGGLDTCQGDSGGPFVCESSQDDFWHLVGVVSTGEGCGRPKTPGFYTRVSQFISWIETTVAEYS